MDIGQIDVLLDKAIQAEQAYIDAKEEESIYRNKATGCSNEARSAWNDVHKMLGQLQKELGTRNSAFNESNLGKLLTFWSENQQSSPKATIGGAKG